MESEWTLRIKPYSVQYVNTVPYRVPKHDGAVEDDEAVGFCELLSHKKVGKLHSV